jgi:ABC-type sugar transport system ATPase subunit
MTAPTDTAVDFCCARDVTVRFPQTVAVDHVTYRAQSGRCVFILGENGAGKSTLMNVLCGIIVPTSGHIEIGDRRFNRLSPRLARRLGINVVTQELSLIPLLRVWENIFLGHELSRMGVLRKQEMRRRASQVMQFLGSDVDVETPAGTLPRGQQQLVEIGRALSGTRGLLILDEATASLSESEAKTLYGVLAHLKTEGWAIAFISHRLAERHLVADDIAILRDGKLVGYYQESDSKSDDELIVDMIGQRLTTLFPARHSSIGTPVLEARDLTTRDMKVQGLSLSLRAGEIVGLGGLAGSGRSETLRAIFGLLDVQRGDVVVHGRSVGHPHPRLLRSLGAAYLPSDRKGEGIIESRTVQENTVLPRLSEHTRMGAFVSRRSVTDAANHLVNDFDVRPPDPKRPIGSLSGGNQQKVLLGRELLTGPGAATVLLLDDPTFGVDIGTRSRLYAEIARLSEEGLGVLMASSDAGELANFCDRVIVMNRGRQVAELSGQKLTIESVVAAAFGHTKMPAE